VTAQAPPLAWAEVAGHAESIVATRSVEALWRGLNFLSAAQLYLADDVLLQRPLRPSDVKATPSGHWGVCPSTNLVLAVLAPVLRALPGQAGQLEVLVTHGAGHAGPSALAYAYLTGDLGRRWPAFRQSTEGLTRLIAGFPHPDTLGSEISPMLPGHRYMGGQLGPALAFATGTVLDSPGRLSVVLIGDGECETGSTAAAWLARRALDGTGSHGCVLPVVLLNGLRMGGLSLLSRLSHDEQARYFTGLGWQPVVPDDDGVAAFRTALGRALRRLVPVGAPGRPPVLLLRLPKGATGPAFVGSRIIGMVATHKTPLRNPRDDADERAALAEWLAGYRPGELLQPDGRPSELVGAALPGPSLPPAGTTLPVPHVPDTPASTLGEATGRVLRRHAAAAGFRVFSPDELASNRVRLVDEHGALPPWACEVLNEEMCQMWLQGYVETGRRGVLISYEAFAAVNTSLLQQYLKYRAVARHVSSASVPSLNYVLTSLGWRNSYSHQNPGLISSLIETADPAVRIYTPADPGRAAAALDAMLRSRGRVNVLVAHKHEVPAHPAETAEEEMAVGAAVWRHLSDPGEPDLVLAAAGDVAARQVCEALPGLRSRRPEAALRVVHIAELTGLGSPRQRPNGLSGGRFRTLFGTSCPVLLLVPGFRGAVTSLLWERPGTQRRFVVLGYRDPGRPVSADGLLRHCRMDRASLEEVAASLLTGAKAGRRYSDERARKHALPV